MRSNRIERECVVVWKVELVRLISMNFMVLFVGTVGSIFVMNGLGAAAEQAVQFNAEARYAQKLCSATGLARAVNHGILPTNIVQVQSSLTMEGWAMWENLFRQFGDGAGFSNSIFEKYVFFPPGLKVPLGPVFAEGVSMNAKPFLDDQGQAYRWIIYQQGDEIDCGPFAEEKVRKMLLQAGIEMPKPLPMPSAVELDAPRRQEEARNQQEMEEELKRFVAAQDNRPVPRPPRVLIPPTSDPNSVGAAKTSREANDASSGTRLLGIVVVLLIGGGLAFVALRQANRKN